MKKSGFTLIELSIVLVIIGLIVGGVLVGNDLIKQAELRTVVSDIQRYQTSFNTFKLKYNCIPGDCKNASTFGLGANGNGNKIIVWSSEGFILWTHLANAGLVSGSYTGVLGSTMEAGVNIPVIYKESVGAFVGSFSPNTFLVWAPTATKHYMFVGKNHSTSQFNTGVTFTPAEALNIDSKVDDGLPETGKLLGGRGWNEPSGWSSCVSSSAYRVTDEDLECIIAYEIY